MVAQSNHDNPEKSFFDIPLIFLYMGGGVWGFLLNLFVAIFDEGNYFLAVMLNLLTALFVGTLLLGIPSFMIGILISLFKLKKGIVGYFCSGLFGLLVAYGFAMGLNSIGWVISRIDGIFMYVFTVTGMIMTLTLSLFVLPQKIPKI